LHLLLLFFFTFIIAPYCRVIEARSTFTVVVRAGLVRWFGVHNQDWQFHRHSNKNCLIAVTQFILKYVPVLVVWELIRHFDGYLDLRAVFGRHSTDLDFFKNLQLVLVAWENEARVLRPGWRSVVLDDQLLLNVIIDFHLVVVGVLNTHETHRHRTCVVALTLSTSPAQCSATWRQVQAVHLAWRSVCQWITDVEATCWKLDRAVVAAFVAAINVLGWVARGRHAVSIVQTVTIFVVVEVPVCVRLRAIRLVETYEHLRWLFPLGYVKRIWGFLLVLIVLHGVSLLLEVRARKVIFVVLLVYRVHWVHWALARGRVLIGTILEGYDWAVVLWLL